MAEFYEYDPMTGIRTDTSWSESEQKMTLIRTADVEPLLDHTKAIANGVGVNSGDIKAGWWLYAKIPPVVILQLRAKGINVFDKNDESRMFAELNSNFPHLKCTTGMHGPRGVKILG